MTIMRDIGLSPLIEGHAKRGEVVLETLNDEQVEALKALQAHRMAYWADLKEFARKSFISTLRAAEDTGEDPTIALANTVADLALRMSDKFSLPMIEIIMFGAPQGDMPAMETTRIIDLD
jgi:hypothetical protein